HGASGWCPQPLRRVSRRRGGGTPSDNALIVAGTPRPPSLIDVARGGAHPELVGPLRPPADASFVIKARHSIFYETPLEHLLRQLGVAAIRAVRPGDGAMHPLQRGWTPGFATSRSRCRLTSSRTSIERSPTP